MSFPVWLWIIPVVIFVVLEGIAIFNKRQGDTASELLRKLGGIKPLRPWRPVGVAVIVTFLAWLSDHLISG